MRSSERPLGYLRRALRDGVRSYLYRSRVRRLLGLPEQGPETYYAVAPPPVGFRYLEPPWPAEGLGRSSPLPPWAQSSRPPGKEALPVPFRLPEPSGSSFRPPGPSGDPGSVQTFPAQRPEPFTETAQPACDRPGSTLPYAQGSETRFQESEPVRGDPAVETTGLNIPGRSSTLGPSRALRASTPEVEVDEPARGKRRPQAEGKVALPEEREEVIERVGLRPAPRGLPKQASVPATGEARGDEPSLVDPAVEALPSAIDPFPALRRSPLAIAELTPFPEGPKRQEERPGVRPAQALEPAVRKSPGSEPDRGDPAVEMTVGVSGQAGTGCSSAAAFRRLAPEESAPARAPWSPLPGEDVRMPGPWGQMTERAGSRLAPGVERPGQDFGIDRIREAVHRLAARTAPAPREGEPAGSEPAAARPAVPRTAPPRPATVVVARAPSPPRTTTAAFWERSYLGHFLLRTVR